MQPVTMKIGGVRDGTVYVSAGRTIGTWDEDSGFRGRGRLPNPANGFRKIGFTVRNAGPVRRMLTPVVGAYTTGNVWPIETGELLATNGNWVFHSPDDGRSWDVVHNLPSSSGPMGTLPTAFAEMNGDLYLAEYPLHSTPGRILRSTNAGRDWEEYAIHKSACHFHGVYADPYGEHLWATTGDADHACAIGILVDGEFRPVGQGSQRWRAVDLAFTPTSIIWGMDAPYAPRIQVCRLHRDDLISPNPTPDILTETDQAVFYTTTTSVGGEEWIFLSTAAETMNGTPAGAAVRRTPEARVLAASSSTDFREWHVIRTFRRRRALSERTQHLPAAGAYVFLETDSTGDVIVNPYNTVLDHGKIIRTEIPSVSPEPHPKLRAETVQ